MARQQQASPSTSRPARCPAPPRRSSRAPDDRRTTKQNRHKRIKEFRKGVWMQTLLPSAIFSGDLELLRGDLGTSYHQQRPVAEIIAERLHAAGLEVLAALVAEGESIIDRVYHIDRGYEKIEQKLAAVGEDRDHMIAEAADVLYHLLVLLHARGIEHQSKGVILLPVGRRRCRHPGSAAGHGRCLNGSARASRRTRIA